MINQRDPRWASIKLGTSNVTIGSHGCTITCIAEAVGKTPDYVNQRLLAVNGYANGNLVIWSKVEEAVGAKTYRYFGYDNAKVLEAISKDGQCLAEVDAKVIGGTGSHWIILRGNKIAGDPWFGEDRPTSNYTFTGYATITYTKPVDPIIEDPCLNYKKELDEKREQISNYDKQVAGLLGEKKQLTTQVDELKAEMGHIRSDLAVSLTKIEGLNTSLATYQKDDAVQLATIRTYESERNESVNALNGLLEYIEESLKLSVGSGSASERIELVKTAYAASTSGIDLHNEQISDLNEQLDDCLGHKEELVKEIERLKNLKRPIDKLSTIEVVQLLLEKLLKRS